MNFSALKPRRKTRVVMVGDVGIGGDEPIRVQTMTNTDTLDIEKTAAQTALCVKAGAELIRITTQSPQHARALGEIRTLLKKKYRISVPLIADVHFSQAAAFEALLWADKVRLNPGNLLDSKLHKQLEFEKGAYRKELKRIEEGLFPFITAAKKARKPIRIGAITDRFPIGFFLAMVTRRSAWSNPPWNTCVFSKSTTTLMSSSP